MLEDAVIVETQLLGSLLDSANSIQANLIRVICSLSL